MSFEPTHTHIRCEEMAARGLSEQAIARMLGVTLNDVTRLRADMKRGVVIDLAPGGAARANRMERTEPLAKRIADFMAKEARPLKAIEIAKALDEERNTISVCLREMRKKSLVRLAEPARKKPGLFVLEGGK